MPIQLQCDSCGRRVKVKEEYAGRKIRCPGCEEPIKVPANGDDFDVDFEEEDFEERPAAKTRRQKSPAGKKRTSEEPQTEKSWFRRNWHWVAVLVMMLFALWPKVGLVVAGLFAAVGLVLALIGGLVMVIVPIGKVLLGDPGTVLSMLLSSSARIRMMQQPDNHPYKVLVRKAFTPTPGLLWTRGVFWKGVLLMVMVIPAAIVNSNIGEVFKSRGPDPGPDPHLVGPGHRPGGVLPQRDPHLHPADGNDRRPGFPPPGGPASTQGGSQALFLYTLSYESFTGEGAVEEAARSALKIHPGFVEDSLKIDEEAKTIEFQLQGGMAPPALGRSFAQRGFPKLSIKMSSQ